MFKDIIKMSFIVLAILTVNAMATNVLTIPAFKSKSKVTKSVQVKTPKYLPKNQIASMLFKSISN